MSLNITSCEASGPYTSVKLNVLTDDFSRVPADPLLFFTALSVIPEVEGISI